MSTERETTGIRQLVASPVIVVSISMSVAIALHYIGGPLLGVALLLWLLLALAIGFALPRWWTLLLAAVPWPVGVGVGLITGRYVFLGDLWQFVALISMLVGLVGIGYGWLARRGWDLQHGRRRGRRR